METNIIHNSDFLRNDLPDHCANLIIADPPYFETKGDFDFSFKDFQEYLGHVEKWGQECARLLAPNGTLIWWGDHERIAYTQVILDKHFSLLANAVWVKRDGRNNRCSLAQQRCLTNVTERFLVYETKGKRGENRGFYSPNAGDFWEGYEPIRQWLRAEFKKLGGTNAVIKATRNGSFSHFVARSQWAFPSPKNVEELIPLYADPSSARAEYEAKRTEYEAKRRPHNGELYKLRNVITASQETHLTKYYDHPTKKPPTLTRQLIETMSRKGDLVVVPFCGSGTECAAAKEVGRNFVAYDTNPDYVKMATKRCAAVKYEPTLL